MNPAKKLLKSFNEYKSYFEKNLNYGLHTLSNCLRRIKKKSEVDGCQFQLPTTLKLVRFYLILIIF